MTNNHLLESLHLRGFLSFGSESEPVKLTGLNVLIGPNGAGKSNFIEAIELLHATPTDFAGAIRMGGVPRDWIWRGTPKCSRARIDAVLTGVNSPPLHYGIEFEDSSARLEISDEVLENAEKKTPQENDVFFYYRFQNKNPVINVVKEMAQKDRRERKLQRESIDPQQSIFSQIRDSESYPEVTETGKRFKSIQMYREWAFGRSSPLRLPQPANLPGDVLLPNLVNLGLVLNELELRPEWERLNELMSRFLPRFARLSTKVSAGSIQVYLREDGLSTPVPATRLSDGTIRFLTLLAILLNPEAAPLICIEEPEMGLHPDAMAIFAELLVEASSKTQIIVTTHSDSLVSELTEHAESVLVCDYGREGTEFTRLDSDKLRFWLDKYRLGDIWRMGELGGNP